MVLALSAEQVRYKAWREAGLNSLFFFAKRVLGYSWLDERVHGPLCRQLEGLTAHLRSEPFGRTPEPRKKLIQWPRKGSKTTITTHSLPLWLLCHNSNLRILIHSETLEGQSQPMMRAIRDHIENGKVFRAIFGDLRGDRVGRKWGDKELILATRTAIGMREASITAGAIGKTETGPHYDLIVSDDPVSIVNTQTREVMDKTLDDHRQLSAVLDKHGVLILVGTPYCWGDLYGYVEQNNAGWDISEKRPVPDMKYDSFYTPEFLASERAALGPHRYGCWYLLNPTNPEDAEFKQEWFTYWNGVLDDLPARAVKVVAVDAALCETRDSDRVGLVVVAKQAGGPVYVIEAKGLRIKQNELVDEIFRVFRAYQPATIMLGKATFEKTLKTWLAEEKKRREVYPTIQTYKGEGQNKSDIGRVRSLAGRYESRMIKHGPTMWELEDELLRFPKGEHIDIADALAVAIDTASKYAGGGGVRHESVNATRRSGKLPGDFPPRVKDWYNN